MRRSAQIAAPVLASAALTILTGCHSTEMQRCVDQQNHVVDPKFCQNLPAANSQQSHGVGFIPIPYHMYYGGLGGYALGSMVSGGSVSPSAGHSYSTTSGTSRGGFGSSFGGGEGGGE